MPCVVLPGVLPTPAEGGGRVLKDLDGVYGVMISGLPLLKRLLVCGVANPYGEDFCGVCDDGEGKGSVRELFSTAAASRPFASSPHRKKSQRLG